MESGVDWKGLAIESLLELQWWRQEYGDRPPSHAVILAMLQPPASISYVSVNVRSVPAPAPGTGLPAPVPSPPTPKRIFSNHV